MNLNMINNFSNMQALCNFVAKPWVQMVLASANSIQHTKHFVVNSWMQLTLCVLVFVNREVKTETLTCDKHNPCRLEPTLKLCQSVWTASDEFVKV